MNKNKWKITNFEDAWSLIHLTTQQDKCQHQRKCSKRTSWLGGKGAGHPLNNSPSCVQQVELISTWQSTVAAYCQYAAKFSSEYISPCLGALLVGGARHGFSSQPGKALFFPREDKVSTSTQDLLCTATHKWLEYKLRNANHKQCTSLSFHPLETKECHVFYFHPSQPPIEFKELQVL